MKLIDKIIVISSVSVIALMFLYMKVEHTHRFQHLTAQDKCALPEYQDIPNCNAQH